MRNHTGTIRMYRGVEISDAWPAAYRAPGAVRDPRDRERYVAYVGATYPFRRLAGRTLSEIRAEISQALGSGEVAE
jgi:hypothetical protein